MDPTDAPTATTPVPDPTPSAATSIELADAFDDDSLEMNEAGDGFRVGDVTGKPGLLANPQSVEVAKAGALVGTRKQVNLVAGANMTITAADNPGADRVDVTLAATVTGGAVYKDSSFVALVANQSTASTTFVDVPTMTLSVTTETGDVLLIGVSGSGNTSPAAANADCQLLVDGTVVAGTNMTSSTSPFFFTWAITWRVAGLAPGAHTVKLQWRTSGAGAPVQIRPVAAPATEHLALLVERVTA